jgi:sec-independent protein translocase protein TatA
MFAVIQMGLLILGAIGGATPIQANVLSPMDMLIVGIIAMLLFGNRLPEVARSLGRSMSEFKKGMQDLESEVKSSLDSASSYRPTGPEPIRSLPSADASSLSREPAATVATEIIQPKASPTAESAPTASGSASAIETDASRA